MTTFVKNLIGGLLIMLVATLVGIAHNAARSNSMVLIPKVWRPVATTEQASTPAESEEMEAKDPPQPVEGDITAGEYGRAELSKERVKALMTTRKIILVDARSEHEFEEGHLPGAINIPYESFVDYYDQLINNVRMDADVVAYCRSLTCDLSDHLAQELRLAGYEKVLLYRGGWDEWTEADYPVEGATDE